MSFWDKVKKAASKAEDAADRFGRYAEEKAKDVKKSVDSYVEEQNNRKVNSSRPEEKPDTAQSAGEFFFDRSASHSSAVEKFNGFIDGSFPDYTVEHDFPANSIKAGVHPKCAPVSYMFLKNGSPCLAVVLVRANNYRGMNVKATKEICEEKGIKYIRFFEEMENRREYVINRIRENLQ